MLCLEHGQTNAYSPPAPGQLYTFGLPVVTLTRDLRYSNNLCPSAHRNDIVAKAHQRAYMIQRAFVLRNE